ncbi:MAG: DNA polymerase I [Chitinophagaceae bacterium]
MTYTKKLFLLDAMALIYRSYFALGKNPLITTYGKNTNAQYGFTNTLLELIRKQEPTHLAVAFDTHTPTERHIAFSAYKAQREDTPEDIIIAVEDIKKILKGFRIPILEIDGYEADDIIGTVAWQASKFEFDVYMVTPDKDYGQLVRKNVFIYRPPYMNNSEQILDTKKICEKWDIEKVSQVIDMLGLMGDVSDNIPGIFGVGEKTASKLLKQYHTLENVLANAHHISGQIGNKIEAGKEQAIMSKKLATIITDVPINFSEEDYLIKPYNEKSLRAIFSQLELRSLNKRILPPSISVVTTPNLFSEQESSFSQPFSTYKNILDTPHAYHLIDTQEKILSLVEKLLEVSVICIDTETTSTKPLLSEFVGISIAYKKGEAFYIPINDNPHAKQVLNLLEPLFYREDILWVGQNIKYDILLLKKYEVILKGKLFDTMIAQYLIDAESKKSMDLLSIHYLGYQPISIETLIGKKGKSQGNMRDVSVHKVCTYAGEDADITLQLKEVLQPLLQKNNYIPLFDEVEMPLIQVLADMEYQGINVDLNFLNQYNDLLNQEIKVLENNIYKFSTIEFNLDSPKQLGEVLFEKLNLKQHIKISKNKRGHYGTGEDILQKLIDFHPIIPLILSYRELAKLRSTYTEALPKMLNPITHKIHTSFNQFITVTGRLSSNEPNLQNIPIRTEKGRQIRKAFIASSNNHILISADYSQIELRIIAAISGDESMCHDFMEDKDIHRATAARVYNVLENEVSQEMRRKAKTVNFGIIYGQSAFGLSENLGISRMEAKILIDTYFAKYPAIQQYMYQQIEFGKKHGYVQTLLGRKRLLKDIISGNAIVRGYAERNAINMPIQGTAADMMKIAMIKVNKAFKQQHLQSKLILQVHDELVVDTLKTEIETVKQLLKENMQTTMILPHDVPVKVDIGMGNNWSEAH